MAGVGQRAVAPRDRHSLSRAVYLDIETDDVASLFDRAVAAGATEIRAPTDPQLPVQAAKVRDPFGHIWLITRSGGGDAA